MELYVREKYLKRIRGFYHSEDIIKVITGVRRCGKSSIMEIIADELRREGISEDHIVYLNLYLRKHRKIKTADQLENLIEENIQNTGLNYLFIDEVQNVCDFEEVLNGFREDGNCSIKFMKSTMFHLRPDLEFLLLLK